MNRAPVTPEVVRTLHDLSPDLVERLARAAVERGDESVWQALVASGLPRQDAKLGPVVVHAALQAKRWPWAAAWLAQADAAVATEALGSTLWGENFDPQAIALLLQAGADPHGSTSVNLYDYQVYAASPLAIALALRQESLPQLCPQPLAVVPPVGSEVKGDDDERVIDLLHLVGRLAQAVPSAPWLQRARQLLDVDSEVVRQRWSAGLAQVLGDVSKRAAKELSVGDVAELTLLAAHADLSALPARKALERVLCRVRVNQDTGGVQCQGNLLHVVAGAKVPNVADAITNIVMQRPEWLEVPAKIRDRWRIPGERKLVHEATPLALAAAASNQEALVALQSAGADVQAHDLLPLRAALDPDHHLLLAAVIAKRVVDATLAQAQGPAP